MLKEFYAKAAEATALMQVRGDWEFYCDIFKFPRWNEANRMCWICRASWVRPGDCVSVFRPTGCPRTAGDAKGATRPV